ncbi:hypothetical protein CIHG_06931 [Coccidioides immitis H538.4]|uniref:Uncharacterized protein n=1 Tax=Coccidioides immitis H538.4 TaxID=396776 RepID=A0A0J8RXF0_COCIT|nr:hypothetical protein CIHG_06931 [Coccidioides immitis H538.4]
MVPRGQSARLQVKSRPKPLVKNYGAFGPDWFIMDFLVDLKEPSVSLATGGDGGLALAQSLFLMLSSVTQRIGDSEVPFDAIIATVTGRSALRQANSNPTGLFLARNLVDEPYFSVQKTGSARETIWSMKVWYRGWGLPESL